MPYKNIDFFIITFAILITILAWNVHFVVSVIFIDNNGCPLLYENGSIIYRDCGFDESYCLSIGCNFTRWSCGRPACRC